MAKQPTTTIELIKTASDYLAQKGIENPRLDAEVLLAATLDTDRVKLYCCFDQPIEEKELEIYRGMIKKRIARMPVAYIVGEKEFYSLCFSVSPEVLIPRPDTETLVEKVLEFLTTIQNANCCDIGTGSGAIPIAVLKNSSGHKFLAIDISEKALEVAKLNATTHGVCSDMEFAQSDILDQITGSFDLIVSNPPYICREDEKTLAPEIVGHEPHQALFSGSDGLDAIRQIIAQAPSHLNSGGALMMEIGHDQKSLVEQLLIDCPEFINLEFFKDLAGNHRVVCAHKG